jgi:predicted XRE-type DNA-binding protein
LDKALLSFAFEIQRELTVSSTSPSLRKPSTSSTASKRSLKKPAAKTSTSRRRATATSSDSELIIEEFADIWDALYDDDPAERERQRIIGDVWSALRTRVLEKGWTQKEAARILGVTQPRISDLMRSKLDLFSTDSLIAMAGRAGIKFELKYTFEP